MACAACQRYPYDPAKASRPYPKQLTQGSVVDMQVIPDVNGGTLTVVNPTATFRHHHAHRSRREAAGQPPTVISPQR